MTGTMSILVIESSLKVNDDMVMSGDGVRQSERKKTYSVCPCSGTKYLPVKKVLNTCSATLIVSTKLIVKSFAIHIHFNCHILKGTYFMFGAYKFFSLRKKISNVNH